MEKPLKNFLGIYMGRVEPMERPDQATMVRGMTAWHKWMTDTAASVVTIGRSPGQDQEDRKGRRHRHPQPHDRLYRRAGREP